MGEIIVVNKTGGVIKVRVTNDGDTGSHDFYIIDDQAKHSWSRGKSQVCFLYNPRTTTTKTFFVTPGEIYTIDP
ncbi:hypothetical protein M405DRAFT_817422, partial [Rhizopogon salebrosus TDB-379]